MSLILLPFVLNPHCFFISFFPTVSYCKKLLGLVCSHANELLGSPKPLCYLNGNEFLGTLRENLFELDCILSHSYTGLHKVILNKSCIPCKSKYIGSLYSLMEGKKREKKKRGGN